MRPGNDTNDWDYVAKTWSNPYHSRGPLAEHKRKTYFALISKWSAIQHCKTILKTDLFDEAFSARPFLFDIMRLNSRIIAIDISSKIAAGAAANAIRQGLSISQILVADVRQIPISSDSVDLIISDSTLDHFPQEEEILVSLKELARVLKPGGVLIITLDNQYNLTYPPYFLMRLWMKLRLSPYFIGRTLSLKKLKSGLENEGMDVVESTAIFHYPHPDGLVRWLEHIVRKLGRGRLDPAMTRHLFWLDRLERLPSRYLTGRYIAVKAVKR